MRYQNAKRIIEILPLLNSSDRECVLLGVAMLKNEPIFANLNKHYKSKIKSVEWPGFDSETPERFKTVRKHISYIFSKKLLDEVFLTEDENLFNIQILTIICWISKYCNWCSKARCLEKYKYICYDEKSIRTIIRNRNHSPLIERYFYHSDEDIPKSGNDRSKHNKYVKLSLIKRHTKKPWQDNRKYNIRHPISYEEYLKRYYHKSLTSNQVIFGE